MGLQVAKQLVKDWLKALAPRGTRRRRLLRQGKELVQYHILRKPRPPVINPDLLPVDVFQAAQLNDFLKSRGALCLEGSELDAHTSEIGAVRFVLTLLQKEPGLRRQFPHAIFGGADGAYCHWLCIEGLRLLKLSPRAVTNIRAAFARRLGERVRQLYDHNAELRACLPLALTPAMQRSFLDWLVREGRPTFGLKDEEVWWFAFESATDPQHGLAATYLRTVDWQERFPLALTVFGQHDFLAWFGDHYRITADWLKEVDFSAVLHPVDQLRLLHTHTPAVKALAPRAFQDWEETNRLVAWLRRKGSRRAGPLGWLWRGDPRLTVIDRRWWARLEAGLKDGLGEQPGVNVVANFCYPSGIQEAARATVRSLQEAGFRTACRDVPATFQSDLPERGDFLDLEVFDRTLVYLAPEPAVERFFPHSGLDTRRGVYRIAVWFWELETVPPEWARYGQQVQEVWAPTRFVAQGMRKVMPVPVVDMLPGVRLGAVADRPREHFGLPADRYLFLFLFDMCSVMERKNPLGLIRAYRNAFRHDDRVALAIKVTRGTSNKTDLARLKEAADAAGVTVIDRTLSREESYGLINACDCYVSLHRSEGFGLTMAEAMLLGKPVIATAYSGNMDFMTPDKSLLVEHERVPITQDLPVYPRGSVWAEPSLEQAAGWMRWVYEHPDEARALGARAKLQTGLILSPEAAGERMRKRLLALQEGKAAPASRAA